MLTRVIVALMVVAVAARAEAQGMFDFLTFDDVHYIRWAEEPGRTLTREDAEIVYRAVAANRERLRPFMPWERTTRSASDTLEFIERSLASPNDLEGKGIWVTDVFAGFLSFTTKNNPPRPFCDDAQPFALAAAVSAPCWFMSAKIA